MTRTLASIASSAAAGLALLLLAACASERGLQVDDIVRVPLAGGGRALSSPAADGTERIRREEALRRDLATGRASDESRDLCSVNGGIEGC